MLGLIIAIILFNTIAYFKVKRLTKLQIVHIWVFTMYFHLIVDLYLSYKLEGYWYFSKGVDWFDFPVLTLLSPPAMLLYLDSYPFNRSLVKRIIYILFWSLIIVVYEAVSLLPDPWGYFHYGWWNLGYSAFTYPLLFIIGLFYYKWIRRLEEKGEAR